MFRFASRCARVSLVGLALALLPAGLLADTREPADRVTVLNAGTFLILEVHQTKLGDVLNRLAAHLKAELFNTDRLNLERIIDGRKRGSLEEVLRWLVRDGGFIIISEEPKPGDPRPPKLAGSTDRSKIRDALRSVCCGAGEAIGPGDWAKAKADIAAGKPDIPSTSASEIMNIAEQLEAQTPKAQQAVEAAAHDPTGQSPIPAFLTPQGDTAQLSLQQQIERSQALAVEQLGQLMQAYKTVCRGLQSGGGKPAC